MVELSGGKRIFQLRRRGREERQRLWLHIRGAELPSDQPPPSVPPERTHSRPPIAPLGPNRAGLGRYRSGSQRSPVWIETRTSRWRPDRDYPLAGGIGFGTSAGIEILRIANAIGKAAAQRSAMNQNARGPNAP